jgi:hypothetical protein
MSSSVLGDRQYGQVIDLLLSKRRDLAAAGASSPGRYASAPSRSRSRPTAPLVIRGSWTS